MANDELLKTLTYEVQFMYHMLYEDKKTIEQWARCDKAVVMASDWRVAQGLGGYIDDLGASDE